ncbi:MAG: DUF937 domain-containing protein [Gammaproteobacteria bacterium]|nr:DUF937 domain-containing protein [Gammaproteobacteria bacterium]
MSFNLVDLVKDQVGGQILGQIGGLMGDQADKAEAGLGSAIPALLSGLTKRAGVPGGADSLFGAVNDADDGMLDNLGALLGDSSQSKSMIDTGSSLLGGLLGNAGLGSLGGIISAVTGLSKGNSGSLLGLLAPVILGVIKRKVLGGGLNASGLLDMLNGQNDNINAAMPAGLSDQLSSSSFLSSITDVAGGGLDQVTGAAGAAMDKAGDIAGNAADTLGNAAGNVTDAAGNVADAAGDAARDAASGGSSMFKKLIPIIGIALLGFLGLKFFGGSAEDAATSVGDAAKDTAAAVSDAVDVDGLSSDLTGMFDTAKTSLEGITDTASAESALPALEEMKSKVDGLGGMLEKIPEAARGPLSGIISTGLETLTPIIEKLRGLPGVGDVIDPIITPVLETLQGLAG